MTDRLDAADVAAELAEQYGGEPSDWDDLSPVIVQRAREIASPEFKARHARDQAAALRAATEASHRPLRTDDDEPPAA